MKTNTIIQDTGSHTFLAGTILFANIDYSGVGPYLLKAVIGGAIWMGFKLAGDLLSQKLLNKKKDKEDSNDKPEQD